MKGADRDAQPSLAAHSWAEESGMLYNCGAPDQWALPTPSQRRTLLRGHNQQLFIPNLPGKRTSVIFLLGVGGWGVECRGVLLIPVRAPYSLPPPISPFLIYFGPHALAEDSWALGPVSTCAVGNAEMHSVWSGLGGCGAEIEPPHTQPLHSGKWSSMLQRHAKTVSSSWTWG